MSPASRTSRLTHWLRYNFFRRWYDGLLTLLFAAGILALGVPLSRWAVTEAAITPDPEACRAAGGACWSVIVDMWAVFLVGLYPLEERWRIAAALLLVLAAASLALVPALRRPKALAAIWPATVIGVLVLVRGGAFGLPTVETQKWGGLFLTVVLAVVSQSIAMPLGIGLALGRHSARSSIVRQAATAYIEVVRSVPLVMVLLMATLVLPLFLPRAMPLDTLTAAAIGITLFSAAAIAEVVRGGLIGLPAEQSEAAAALGLRHWQGIRLVVLPQALRRMQPALVGTLITFVKGSSLVVAIGLYDLLGGAVLAASNPKWLGHSIEALLFVGFVFWAICFALSQYSRHIEKRFARNSPLRAAQLQ